MTFFVWFLDKSALSAKLTHGYSLCGLLNSLHGSVSHPQGVPDLTWGSHESSKEADAFYYAKTMDRSLAM